MPSRKRRDTLREALLAEARPIWAAARSTRTDAEQQAKTVITEEHHQCAAALTALWSRQDLMPMPRLLSAALPLQL